MLCHGLTDASSPGDTLEIYLTQCSVNGPTEVQKLIMHGRNHSR